MLYIGYLIILDGQSIKKISSGKFHFSAAEAGSWARGHMGGGATGGTWSWDPEPPPWVRGSIYKKKNF